MIDLVVHGDEIQALQGALHSGRFYTHCLKLGVAVLASLGGAGFLRDRESLKLWQASG